MAKAGEHMESVLAKSPPMAFPTSGSAAPSRPSLLHQDPRYFYQGTGTTSSRFRHALLNAFVARGDDAKAQPNYSGLGGVLASSSLASLYYPRSNRGAGLVFGDFAIGVAERIGASMAQEFLLGRFTRRGGHMK
jgi:hypothetical protein